MRFSWPSAALAAAFYWLGCSPDANQSGPRSILSQESFTDVPALVARFQAATREEAEQAKLLLAQGNKAADERRWGPAFKLYGESILLQPSQDALLGIAQAQANISRNQESCSATLAAKENDLQQARRLLISAKSFGKAIGQSSQEQQQATLRTGQVIDTAKAQWIKDRQLCREP